MSARDDTQERIHKLVVAISDMFRAEGPLEQSMPIISTVMTELLGRWMSVWSEADRDEKIEQLVAWARHVATTQDKQKENLQ